jgi:hypothetical protein
VSKGDEFIADVVGVGRMKSAQAKKMWVFNNSKEDSEESDRNPFVFCGE